MNFTRGKQVVLYNSTYRDTRGNILNPPDSFHTRTIYASDSAIDVFGDVSALAATSGKLDAIHIISHGCQNFIQFGKENISTTNFDIFLGLTNAVRTIVIWACEVGRGVVPGASENYSALGAAIAGAAQARVIVGRDGQLGRANSLHGFTNGKLNFQPEFFKGETYIFHKDGGHTVVFTDPRTDNAPIDIEHYIFASHN